LPESLLVGLGDVISRVQGDVPHSWVRERLRGLFVSCIPKCLGIWMAANNSPKHAMFEGDLSLQLEIVAYE